MSGVNMIFKHAGVICLLLSFANFSEAIKMENRLDIDILYESLCPDSLDFIKNQLHPTYNEIAEFVKIKFVPFGKSASFNNGDDFECQHGPKECMGNRLQSCTLSAIQNQNAEVDYVNCFMNIYRKNRRNDMEFGQRCAADAGVEWAHVKKCYESTMGRDLQLAAEQDTIRIRPRFVPTILYNGVFDQRAQDASLVDFRSVVCSYITQLYPNACQRNSVLRI